MPVTPTKALNLITRWQPSNQVAGSSVHVDYSIISVNVKSMTTRLTAC